MYRPVFIQNLLVHLGAKILLMRRLNSPRGGRPWPRNKTASYRAVATGSALLTFALCLGAGQRIGNALKMRWSDNDGDGMRVLQNMTGARLWVPFSPHLRTVLSSSPKLA